MKNKLTKMFASILVTASVSAGAVALSAPAQAGSGGCTLGYACLWESRYFEGRSYGKKFDGVVKASIDNNSNAAAANGKSCGVTRFYDAYTYRGSYFYLQSETKERTNYRDPYLTNGAGKGPNSDENWQDRISYIYFDKCD